MPEFQGTGALGSPSLLAFPDSLHSLHTPCALARLDPGGQIWAQSQYRTRVRDSAFQPFPFALC